MPSKELEYLVLYLIKKHKDEILRDRDWWYGIPEYTINVHDYNEKDIFHINVYEVGENGMDDYSHWEDLPSLTKKELKAL
jgi:hypothetical protein